MNQDHFHHNGLRLCGYNKNYTFISLELLPLGRDERIAEKIIMNVNEIMSKHITTVSPDTSVMEAASLICLYRYSRIPVADNGKLVGMVSLGDIHKAIFHQSIKASPAS